MKPIFSLILFLFLFSTKCLAQKEASIWPIGAGKQISFQSGEFEYLDYPNSGIATICDKDGNLVLSTDGKTIWNDKNEILINGDQLLASTEIITPFTKPVFLPYPQKDGWYILLYESTPKNGYELKDKKLYYAEINAKANNGQGEVVTQRVKIHNDYHYTFTVSGYCNDSYYWIAIDRNDNMNPNIRMDRIYFYRIDKNGVSIQPQINSFFDIGNSFGYKFTPNGDKLFFRAYINHSGGTIYDIVADFNFLTGELYNYKILSTNASSPVEFSPDSRFIYFISNDSILCQVDARYSSESKMNQTITPLVDFPAILNGIVNPVDFQLAPDGKIYFIYIDRKNGKNKLGRINNPKIQGIGCGVDLDILPINNSQRLPAFVTSFFREDIPKDLDEQKADTGPDKIICALSKNTLGTQGNKDAFYSWFPDEYIENPFKAITTFQYPFHLFNPIPVEEVLRVSDGNCWMNFDTVMVTVKPSPKEPVLDGSWSVCPFVEKVDYWVMENDPTLQWLVDGGEIKYGNSPDSIKINWWDTNSNASASAVVHNNYGCYDTTVFPVRINVELITETPKGPKDLCIAEAKNIAYRIRNTHGSVYEWIAEGGEVVSGQGTNEVIVNWKEGKNKLSVLESSTTIDTICFGESEPLLVDVLNDSLGIQLTNVSFNPDNNIEVYFESNKFITGNRSLILIAEEVNSGKIEEYPVQASSPGHFTYPAKPENTGPQSITLKVINLCNEIFYSAAQQTIYLIGEVLPDELAVSLNWNINQSWEASRLKHEIWHSADGIHNWQLIAALGEDTVYNYHYSNNSLFHYFRVKEINQDKNLESWSNSIKVEIDDDLLIPGVFTPNSDGYNDVWEIRNIIFHPLKSLVVYNKTGKPVYQCKNEFIPWDGKIDGKIYQGTYFYQLAFEGGQIRYGQITVLK